MTLQSTLIALIKQKLKRNETIGSALSELLNISPDAVYRRTRNETHFSIYELEKICERFNISLDELFDRSQKSVSFDYQPLDNQKFKMSEYLKSIRDSLLFLKNQGNPKLLLTINNTPFFQLFNCPNLVRFKLFFWAKTHLQVEEYQEVRFSDYTFTEEEQLLGNEILRIYTTIPTTELYDPELMRGFAREIYYYYSSQEIEDGNYVLQMYDEILLFIGHLKHQAKIGKKFIVQTAPPAGGNKLEMYYNETLNSVASFYYTTDLSNGLFMAHNFMNSLHTTNKEYVLDTKNVLDRIISNSSKISVVSSKERNHYFSEIEKLIKSYIAKVKLDLKP